MKYLTLLMTALLMTGSAYASEHPAWSYEGDGAPEHWGDLSADFSQCKTGMNQSPINITSTQKTHLAPLDFRFGDVPLTEINNGHTVQVNDDGGDELTLDNEKFSLQQFHFHTPSENTIDGKSFPLEAHFVHKNDKDEIAVIAVMFQTGKENPELQKLWQAMPGKAGEAVSIKQKLDLKGLFPADLSYYRFSGSLTTPPCTEGVRWLVIKQPMTVSEQQVEKFAATMHHHNNRPVQPLHGRMIVE